MAEGLPVIHDFVVRHGRTQGPNQSKGEKRFVNQLLVLPGAVWLHECILIMAVTMRIVVGYGGFG